MGLAHGGDYRLDQRFGTDYLETPLGNFLPAALLANGRIRRVGAEKRAGSRQAEAALAVLADVSGTGGEQCIRDTVKIAVRDEDPDLARPRSGPWPQRPDIHQAQSLRESLVDAVARI